MTSETPLPTGITIHVPDRERRDRVMGEYMDAWSRTENLLRECIREILGLDQHRAQAIFAAMMIKQTIDLLDSLASTNLTPAGAARVHKLCERLSDRNRRRNNIVHGNWRCHVVDPSAGEAIWLRVNTAIDLSLAKLPHTDPKIAGLYSFTVDELAATASLLEPVAAGLAELLREIPALTERA